MTWATNAATRRSMQGNKSKDTLAELAIRRALHAQGFRYRVNIRPLPTLRRTADVVFPRVKIAVFIDGCFWHACPIHYVEPKVHIDYWRPKIDRNHTRDVETTCLREQAGWTVMRFWGHQLSEEVAGEIAAAVRAARMAMAPKSL